MTIRLSHLVAGEAPLPREAEALFVAGLTADSRAVRPGFVFAALPGTHVDGAAFIPQAIAAGAIAVLAGAGVPAAGFTNLSHDHLDYHPTVEDYFNAKMRLFEELVAPGGAAVINVDTPRGEEAARRARVHGLKLWSVGLKGDAIRVVNVRREAGSQHVTVAVHGRPYEVDLPLAGDFQVSNALIAAGLVLATGGDEAQVMHALQSLKGAKGRLELVGRSAMGAPVFVDYAHKPDALENALASLRPYTRGRLLVVFGCGGDRDRAKRPIMGEIATRLADKVYVTDDNPRTEDPTAIRAAIMAAAPGAIEIGSRADAIRMAVAELQAGDVLIVAGKGHEEGQKIGKQVLPFSDHEAVKAALAGRDYHG